MSSLPAVLRDSSDDDELFDMDSASAGAGESRRGKAKPFLIGVCGGTASGKTTVCEKIIDKLNDRRACIISMDCYYRGLTPEESANVSEYNFDHPDAFDFDAICESLTQLSERRGVVTIPHYDFKTHQRVPDQGQRVSGVEVIIFEGIMTFHDHRLRELFDMKIFVDTDADTRLVRRIRRDISERGRSVVSVLHQYEKFVKPAYDDHILPTKRYADVIIPRGGDNEVAIDLIAQHIRARLDSVRATALAQHNPHAQRAGFM